MSREKRKRRVKTTEEAKRKLLWGSQCRGRFFVGVCCVTTPFALKVFSRYFGETRYFWLQCYVRKEGPDQEFLFRDRLKVFKMLLAVISIWEDVTQSLVILEKKSRPNKIEQDHLGKILNHSADF